MHSIYISSKDIEWNTLNGFENNKPGAQSRRRDAFENYNPYAQSRITYAFEVYKSGVQSRENTLIREV